MSRIPTVTLISTALVAAGMAYWVDAAPRKWPKPTPPPPPSPIYHDLKEVMPTEEEIARAAEEHTARLQQEIEQALAKKDKDRIEAVFVFLLPELLQVEPARVVDMVAAQKPGESRDRLRDAVARQWVVMDVRSAMDWMKTLEDTDRRAAAKMALTNLRPIDPSQATLLAQELSVDTDEPMERVSAR